MSKKHTITSLDGFYQLIFFKKAELKVIFRNIFPIIGAYIRQAVLFVLAFEGERY